MKPAWTADVKRDYHLLKLTNRRLSKLTGYTEEYISMMLNGKRTSETAKLNILNAIESERSRLMPN